MKKTLGLLVFLFIIVLASPLGPARADDFTSGDIVIVTPSISEQDLETYNNALQVVEYLRQGGSIDFSNVSDEYTSGDLLEEFVDLIDTVGSGIDYYGNNFLNSIFNLSSDTVQLSPNTKLKNRINQFRSNLPSYLRSQQSDDTPTPTPNPDPNYLGYLDKINGRSHNYSNFWFYDIQQNYSYYDSYFGLTYSYNNSKYPITNYSWVVIQSTGNVINYGDTPTYHNTPFIIPVDILNINIIGSGNNYSYSTSYSTSSAFLTYSETTTNNQTYYKYANYITINDNDSRNKYGFMNNNPIITGTYNRSYTGTLADVLNDITKYFKNCNIYVNGIPWSLVGDTIPPSYNIGLGTGTYLIETNQPIEYRFEIPVYVDVSDLIDKIQLAIDNKISLDFPYLNDLIVDTNGQQTIAVTVFQEDYTLDDLYVKDYGAMIPVFPLFVEYPVSLQSINNVATVGIVDVVPDEILEIFGMFLIGGLFVLLCHRLME